MNFDWFKLNRILINQVKKEQSNIFFMIEILTFYYLFNTKN